MIVSHHDEAAAIDHGRRNGGQAFGTSTLSEAERKQKQSPNGKFHSAISATSCIHTLFEAQVDARPAATAIIFEDNCWSYEDVDARANQLARFLRAGGV